MKVKDIFKNYKIRFRFFTTKFYLSWYCNTLFGAIKLV